MKAECSAHADHPLITEALQLRHVTLGMNRSDEDHLAAQHKQESVRSPVCMGCVEVCSA